MKCKKVADNHPGYRGNFFFNFGPPSTGELRFSVSARAGPGISLSANGRPREQVRDIYSLFRIAMAVLGTDWVTLSL